MAIASMAGGGAPIPNNSGAPIPGLPGGGSGVTQFVNEIRRGFAAARENFANDVPVVYLGTERDDTRDAERGRGGLFRDSGQAVDQFRSIAEMMGDFDSLSEKRKRKMAEKLAIAGFFEDQPNQGETLEQFLAVQPLGAVEDAYSKLLSAASARYMSGQAITPNQLLKQYMDYRQSSAKAAGLTLFSGGSGMENFTGTKVSHAKVRDIFSAQEARGVARQALQQELGRDPTEEEYEDFVAAIQAKQRSTPARETTRSVWEDGEVVSTDKTTRGGFDLAEFALQEAKQNPGWAEWQAAGQYFPVVLNALGAGVPGV